MIENKEIPEEFKQWAEGEAPEDVNRIWNQYDPLHPGTPYSNAIKVWIEGAKAAYRHLSTQPSYPRWWKEYEKSPPNGSYHCRIRIPNEPPYPTVVKGVVDYEDGQWNTGSVDEKILEWLQEAHSETQPE